MLAVGEAMNHVENIKSDAAIKIRAPMIARSFSRTKPRDSQEYKTKWAFNLLGFMSMIHRKRRHLIGNLKANLGMINQDMYSVSPSKIHTFAKITD